MSPAQAAQLKNVSRRTIMRAIESHELKAFRDNRNHWRIAPQDLDKWANAQWAPTEHAHLDLPTVPTPDLAVMLARVEAERNALRELLEQTKEDRDHWRRLAERQHDLSKLKPKRFGIFKYIFGG
jgi:excisionase family DNA binding protein